LLGLLERHTLVLPTPHAEMPVSKTPWWEAGV
jgi:hypothetical protein